MADERKLNGSPSINKEYYYNYYYYYCYSVVINQKLRICNESGHLTWLLNAIIYQ